MCRYCKKLNQVMDLERKQLTDCIKKWKLRDRKARLLLGKCLLVLADVKFSFTSFGGSFDSFDDQVLFRQIHDFLESNWIGD